MTVGENIRKYRKRQGLTQKKLAELSNLNEVTIRSYEAGKYSPKLDSLQKISRALGVYIGNLDENWERFIDDWNNVDFDSFSTPLTAFSERIKREAEHDEQLLLNDYRKLNTEGQKEAKKRIQELTEIKRYTEIEEPPLE